MEYKQMDRPKSLFVRVTTLLLLIGITTTACGMPGGASEPASRTNLVQKTPLATQMAPTVEEPTLEFGINEHKDTGERLFYGEMPDEMVELVDNLVAIADANPDIMAGTALTSDRQVLEVFVIDKTAPSVELLRQAAADMPERLRLVENQYSATELLRAAELVSTLDVIELGIVGCGPDPLTDSLAVDILPSIFDADGGAALGQVIKAVLEDGNASVPLTFQPRERSPLLSG